MIKSLGLLFIALSIGQAHAASPVLLPGDGGTGGTGGVGGTAFTGTGESSSATLNNRITLNGALLDARYSLGMVCDGSTNDDAVFSAWLASHQIFVGTISFPSLCVINPTAHAMPPGISIRGQNGGGLMLPASANITGNVLQWATSLSGLSVKDLKFDVNGSAPLTGNFGVFAFLQNGSLGVDSLVLSGDAIINGGIVLAGAGTNGKGNGLDLIRIFGPTKPILSNLILGFVGNSPHHNQTINIGANSGAVASDVVISNIVQTNSGMFLGGLGGRLSISGVTGNGWGYGACIAVEPVGGASDTAFKGGTISDWNCQNSTAVADENGTKLRSIEVGYGGISILLGTSSNTCGNGIFSFGPGNLILGANIDSPGTCLDSIVNESGVAVGAVTGGNGAQRTFINGVTVTNALYGFAANTPIPLNVTLGVNNFSNNRQGAYYIGAQTVGVSFAAPQSANRIVNPCGRENARNGATPVSVSFGPDQWVTQQTVQNGALATVQETQGFGACQTGIRFTTNTVGAPAATDISVMFQPILSSDVIDFDFQSTFAKNLIVAMTAKTGLPSLFPAAFKTSAFLQDLTAGVTWLWPINLQVGSGNPQQFSTVIPGDVVHALGNVATPSAVAAHVGINMGSGSAKLSACDNGVGPYVGIFYGCASDQTLVTQAVGSYFEIGEVRLFAGATDNGWQPLSVAEDIAKEQRFFQTSLPFGYDAKSKGFTIFSLTSSGATATATVSTTSGLTTGETVTVNGATPAAYNVAAAITVTDQKHFTYTFAGGTSPATGSSIYAAAPPGILSALCAFSQITGSTPSINARFVQPMAIPPVVTLINPNDSTSTFFDVTGAANVAATLAANNVSEQGFSAVTGVTVIGGHQVCEHYTADAGQF